MTVSELCEACGFSPLVMPEPEREVKGAYIGDLLSWVMGRAECDNAWITIMSNINVIAVASLADVACVILSEGVTLEEDIANEKPLSKKDAKKLAKLQKKEAAKEAKEAKKAKADK